MDTPSIPNSLQKADTSPRAQREAKSQPAGGRRAEGAAASQSRTDSAEFTARAHLEAARGQAATMARPDAPDTDNEIRDPTPSVQRPEAGAITDGRAAEDAAREASDRILAQPLLAAGAQAHSRGAAVLAMLQ